MSAIDNLTQEAELSTYLLAYASYVFLANLPKDLMIHSNLIILDERATKTTTLGHQEAVKTLFFLMNDLRKAHLPDIDEAGLEELVETGDLVSLITYHKLGAPIPLQLSAIFEFINEFMEEAIFDL